MIHAYTQQLGAREAPLGTREAPQRSREAPLGSMEVPQRSREVPLGSMEVPLGSREMSLDSMGGMALSLASESLDMDSSQSLPNQRLVIDFLMFLYRWISIYNTTPLLILFLHPLSYFFSWSLHMCHNLSMVPYVLWIFCLSIVSTLLNAEQQTLGYIIIIHSTLTIRLMYLY